MKLIRRRFLSLLLVLVMVLGMIPTMASAAETEGPTSWLELVQLLTDPEDQVIILEQDISYSAKADEDPTVTIVGNKLLNLNGHTVTVDDDSNGVDGASRPLGSEQLDRTLFTVPAGAKLANATGAYGLAISEHMIGCLFELRKKLHLYYKIQQ